MLSQGWRTLHFRTPESQGQNPSPKGTTEPKVFRYITVHGTQAPVLALRGGSREKRTRSSPPPWRRGGKKRSFLVASSLGARGCLAQSGNPSPFQSGDLKGTNRQRFGRELGPAPPSPALRARPHPSPPPLAGNPLPFLPPGPSTFSLLPVPLPPRVREASLRRVPPSSSHSVSSRSRPLPPPAPPRLLPQPGPAPLFPSPTRASRPRYSLP